MMTFEQKHEILLKHKEQELTKRFLMPLFRNMGFKDVDYFHGFGEFGKDVVMYEETILGRRKCWAAQVKSGDVDSDEAEKLVSQTAKAYGKTFTDPKSKKEIRPDAFMIVFSGCYKGLSRETLVSMLQPRDLDKFTDIVDGNDLIGLIDKHFPEGFWDEYDYFKKYFDAMRADFTTIKEMSMLGDKDSPTLEDLYVSLKLTDRADYPDRMFDEREMERYGAIKEFGRHAALMERRIERGRVVDTDRALCDHQRLVIVGAPGSGKTTLLRYTALTTCKKNLDCLERECVPVPITLAMFAQSGKSLREYIDEVFDKYGFPRATKIVEQDLKQGKCRLLLDGFDELAIREKQQHVADEILAFAKKYEKCKIVATSRIAGYNNELRGFKKLELLEFDDKQTAQFINNWFGKNNPEKADKMRRAMRENKNIKKLARNPLMIAIIAVICEENTDLPRGRAELYEKCVDVLLAKWDIRRRIQNRFPAYKKKFFLRKVAYSGHERPKREFDERELKDIFLDLAPQIGLGPEDATPFIDEIWKRSFLLRQIADTKYDFPHLSFQEYFTALELKERTDAAKIIIENLHKSWWEEPILLFAGLKEADLTELIQTIRNEKEDIFFSNLLMCGKLVAHSNYTKEETRDSISLDLWNQQVSGEYHSIQDSAMKVLALIKPDNIVDILIKILEDRNPKDAFLRILVVQSLEQIGSERAIDKLLKCLKEDEDVNVRMSVTDALGNIGAEYAADPLLQCLMEDDNTDVRRSAADALSCIGSEHLVEPLIQLLSEDTNKDLKGNSIIALGNIKFKRAGEPILRFFENNDDEDMLGRAALSLGRIRYERAIKPLFQLIIKNDMKSAFPALCSVQALEQIGSEDVIEPLTKILDKCGSIIIKARAAEALGKIKAESAFEPLLRCFELYSQTEIKMEAAIALECIRPNSVVDKLINIIKNECSFDCPKIVARTLGIIGTELSVEPLIKCMNDFDYELRSSAAFALGRIGDERAIAPLLRLFEQDTHSLVRNSAAISLGTIGNVSALNALKRSLRDNEKGDFVTGREYAFEALHEISLRHGIRIYPESLME